MITSIEPLQSQNMNIQNVHNNDDMKNNMNTIISESYDDNELHDDKDHDCQHDNVNKQSIVTNHAHNTNTKITVAYHNRKKSFTLLFTRLNAKIKQIKLNIRKLIILKQLCKQYDNYNADYYRIDVYENYKRPDLYSEMLRKSEETRHHLMKTININDYIGLLTFNNYDLKQISPLLSVNNHMVYDDYNNGEHYIETIIHYIRFYSSLSNHISIRELLLNRIVMELDETLQSEHANSNYVNDDGYFLGIEIKTNLKGMLTYVNNIITGYPHEYAYETMLMSTINDNDNTSELEPHNNANDDSNASIIKDDNNANNMINGSKPASQLVYIIVNNLNKLMMRIMQSSYYDSMNSFLTYCKHKIMEQYGYLKWIITYND